MAAATTPGTEAASSSIAGQKRKRIDFVLATEKASTVTVQPASSRSSDLYWAIVTGSKAGQQAPACTSDTASINEGPAKAAEARTVCTICGMKLPDDTDPMALVAHEASIPHQSSLQHRYPPSAIDRKSKGFDYLSSHGWDPDSHIGLGAKGEGRLEPVKAVEKRGKSGIGLAATVSGTKIRSGKKDPPIHVTKTEKKRQEKAKARKDKKYEALIMGRHDVNEYTGIGL